MDARCAEVSEVELLGQESDEKRTGTVARQKDAVHVALKIGQGTISGESNRVPIKDAHAHRAVGKSTRFGRTNGRTYRQCPRSTCKSTVRCGNASEENHGEAV